MLHRTILEKRAQSGFPLEFIIPTTANRDIWSRERTPYPTEDKCGSVESSNLLPAHYAEMSILQSLLYARFMLMLLMFQMGP